MMAMAYARLAAAFLIAASAATMTSAQVVPSVSTDPLNGSTFTTPVFSVTPTYTITTTFPSAGVTTPTVISGAAGPSPATGAYSYSYNAPQSSLAGITNYALSSSLAANGIPVAYTAAFQPDTKDLQIVDSAYMADVPFLAVGTMAIAGTLAALWVL